jgi:hypothetical protein
MHNLIIRRWNAFDRVIQFGVDHPLAPARPAVTTLFTELGTIVTALGQHADDQEIGRSGVRGGTAFRQFKADALRTQMRPINRLVRAMNREQNPGLREKFRMPRGGGYRALIARAEAFLDAISPIKATLIARGLPADFDEQLQAARTELASATSDMDSGIVTQTAGTAGLLAKSRDGAGILRELDSMLSYQYRNDPALLAGWKSACRIERAAKRSKPASAPAAAPAAPTPAPAA